LAAVGTRDSAADTKPTAIDGQTGEAEAVGRTPNFAGQMPGPPRSSLNSGRLTELLIRARDYAALLNSANPRWQGMGGEVRANIETMQGPTDH
jgi:hypothetical protein